MATNITDISPIEKELTITVPYDQIEAKVKQELSKLRASVQIKGFRKGKTPLSFIKRHYGGEVRSRSIFEIAEEQLQEAIKPLAEDMLFEPAVRESNFPQVIDEKKDLEMTFILPLANYDALKGLHEDNIYDHYRVIAEKEDIDGAIENMLQRMGTVEEVDDVQAEDIIEVDVQELAGDEIKEDGVQSVFKFAQDLVTNDELKSSLIGKKVGERFRFDIRELETGRPEEYIRKYMLQLTDDDEEVTYDPHFEGEILSISRRVPATLGEEFFERHFPNDEDFHSEETFRDYIAEQISSQFTTMADDLLIKQFSDRYYEQDSIPIHEHFYQAKQMLTDDMEDRDQRVDEIRLSTLQNIITHKFRLQPTESEVRDQISSQLMYSQFGPGLDTEALQSIVTNLMKNEEYAERASEQVYIRKLLNGIKEHCELLPVDITRDDLATKHDEAFPKVEEEE